MKKIYQLKLGIYTMLIALAFTGCLKDTCSERFTIYLPVYKTVTEVRANIKSNTPKTIINPGKLFVYGNYVFLNEVDKGVHIIDNSNPASPINKYFIDIPGNVDLAVTGTTLYADLYTDLVTLDITDPTNVQVKKIIDNAFPFRRFINGFAPDSTRIITDWVAKDTSMKVECGAAWPMMRFDNLFLNSSMASASSQSPGVKGMSGSMARFTLMNNFLYTVTDNVLNVFNISQPQQPQFSNKVTVGGGIETIYPFKNNLFIGSATGMFIYGTTNASQPNLLGAFTHARACDPVIADDNFAFVTLRTGTRCAGNSNQLDVINIQNVMAPKLVKTYQLSNPQGLSKDGNTLIVCDGSAGLKVYDAADVNALKLLSTVEGINAYDVITINGIAIVVAKDGLYQYNYLNPSKVSLLSKIVYQ